MSCFFLTTHTSGHLGSVDAREPSLAVLGQEQTRVHQGARSAHTAGAAQLAEQSAHATGGTRTPDRSAGAVREQQRTHCAR